MSDKKGGGGDGGGGSVDPWTYQCGKCGADFKTAAERDQVRTSFMDCPSVKLAIVIFN